MILVGINYESKELKKDDYKNIPCKIEADHHGIIEEGRGVSDMDDARRHSRPIHYLVLFKRIFHTAGIAEQTCILGLSVPVVSRQ